MWAQSSSSDGLSAMPIKSPLSVLYLSLSLSFSFLPIISTLLSVCVCVLHMCTHSLLLHYHFLFFSFTLNLVVQLLITWSSSNASVGSFGFGCRCRAARWSVLRFGSSTRQKNAMAHKNSFFGFDARLQMQCQRFVYCSCWLHRFEFLFLRSCFLCLSAVRLFLWFGSSFVSFRVDAVVSAEVVQETVWCPLSF